MKRERAYVEGRRSQVLDVLERNPQIRTDELAKSLGVSVVTIRRDLQYLEEKKQITRFYGGAAVSKKAAAYADDVAIYRELIAKYAATLVDDGDTIFINTSSNALDIVKYIKGRHVTVITNNGKAISQEKAEGVDLILTGGEIRHPKEALVGDFATRNLQNIFAKKAFMGCAGISAATGMSTEIANEVNVNQLMIGHTTQEVYLLADHTKVGHSSSFTSCGIESIKHLITDELAPAEELEQLRAQGVEVYQVRRSNVEKEMRYWKNQKPEQERGKC